MATTEDADAAPDAYTTLLEQYQRVANVEAASGLLSWDQQVTMPEGGAPARGQQLSTLSGLQHELLTDDAVADALDELDESELTDEQAAVVREIRRDYERAPAGRPQASLGSTLCKHRRCSSRFAASR